MKNPKNQTLVFLPYLKKKLKAVFTNTQNKKENMCKLKKKNSNNNLNKFLPSIMLLQRKNTWIKQIIKFLKILLKKPLLLKLMKKEQITTPISKNLLKELTLT